MDSPMLASPSSFASLLSSLVGSNHFRDYIPNHRQKLTVCFSILGPHLLGLHVRSDADANPRQGKRFCNWHRKLACTFVQNLYALSTDNAYIGVYLLGASIPRSSQNTDLEILLHLRW
jgi:hypothetical protein